MKTPFYTGCLSFISDTNKGFVSNVTGGEGVKDVNAGKREPKKEKK